MKALVVIAAGGTGGHINAALALGEAFEAQGFRVRYFSGMRPLDHKLYAGRAVTHLESWPLRTKNPLTLLKAALKNLLVFVQLLRVFWGERPAIAAGAGGYVCGPVLLAARLLGARVYIFEQNAVMGLTNRLLAYVAHLVFVHFKETRRLPEGLRRKVRVVGNPTRATIIRPQPRAREAELRVLIFGGSLGARQLNAQAERLAAEGIGAPLHIVHQSGDDVAPVTGLAPGVRYEKHKYLDHIQRQYEWADVIVARAGASTVSELRIVGKPAFLVPFPGATDNHQWWNAKQLQAEAGFTVEVVPAEVTEAQLRAGLRAFLERAASGGLSASQSGPAAVESTQQALREMLSHARLI